MARYLGWGIYDPFGPLFNELNICEIIRQEKINDILVEHVIDVFSRKYKN
jgi:hypothetical protein